MIFQELMKKYDAEEVYPVYHTYYADEPEGSDEERQRHKDFCRFYNDLKGRRPMIGDDIIIVTTLYGSEFTQLCATLYFKEVVEEEFDANSPLKNMSLADIDSLSESELDTLAFYSGLPRGSDFRHLRWAEVLGAEISKANILSVGEVPAIAAVLYEIAFWGYDDREIRERKRQEREKSTGSLKLVVKNEEPRDPQAQKEHDEFCRKESCNGFRIVWEEYQRFIAYFEENQHPISTLEEQQ